MKSFDGMEHHDDSSMILDRETRDDLSALVNWLTCDRGYIDGLEDYDEVLQVAKEIEQWLALDSEDVDPATFNGLKRLMSLLDNAAIESINRAIGYDEEFTDNMPDHDLGTDSVRDWVFPGTQLAYFESAMGTDAMVKLFGPKDVWVKMRYRVD